jgi:hypothetical protein
MKHVSNSQRRKMRRQKASLREPVLFDAVEEQAEAEDAQA